MNLPRAEQAIFRKTARMRRAVLKVTEPRTRTRTAKEIQTTTAERNQQTRAEMKMYRKKVPAMI